MEGGRKAVGERLETLYNEVSAVSRQNNGKPRLQGTVTLVGTGPGDPELLTLKARRLLHEAEVVLHDHLVTPQILELARREATLVHVGKKGFGKSWKQEDINALLIEHANRGASIVRLKSGDPSVFGRMDEELDALEDAAKKFEKWDPAKPSTSPKGPATQALADKKAADAASRLAAAKPTTAPKPAVEAKPKAVAKPKAAPKATAAKSAAAPVKKAPAKPRVKKGDA